MTELIIRYAEPSGIADKTVIPSEVVGELVRCKDCRWFKQDSSLIGYGYCDGRMGGKGVDYNDYCFYGERRDE